MSQNPTQAAVSIPGPLLAIFHPQAWVNDWALEVDPEGETEFDVGPEIRAMGREKALTLLTDDNYDTDELRTATNAPDWVKNWSGPFRIEVKDAISAYYGVNREDSRKI